MASTSIMQRSHILSFLAGSLGMGVMMSLLAIPVKPPAQVPREGPPPLAQELVPMATEAAETEQVVSKSALPPTELVESFNIDPIDLATERVEPITEDIETFFEEFLGIKYTPEKIVLGKMLFHDVRLSGDSTISCASCHDLRYAGIDRAVTATGSKGQVGPINTPTVFNSVFNMHQFWDGRSKDLSSQAAVPISSSTEMNSNWKDISAKLCSDAGLMKPLKMAYPDADFSGGVQTLYWLDAIADYERTLITPNSPFDQYLRGDSESISKRAKEGYQLFKSVGCIECHNGPSIGGKSFQRLGRKRDYFDGHSDGVNLGRFNITGAEKDRYVFKVPNLRNVALTGPWLHDGSQETLSDVVRIMGFHQLDRSLSDAEVERIVAFLESLTGDFQGQSLGHLQNTTNRSRGVEND